MPRGKKNVVKLSDDERQKLKEMLSKGRSNAQVIRRANILLLAEQNKTDREVSEVLDCSEQTVLNIRKRFVERGLDGALYDKPRPGAQRKLDAKKEAHLIALTCSEAPEGRERWTLRLLKERYIELGYVESICPETIRQTLKKTLSNRGRKNSGVLAK